MNKTLKRRDHIGELTEAGDYCLVRKSGEWKVVMACPVCAAIFYCPHNAVSLEPLTLSPSVVGPDRVPVPKEEWGSQVLGTCLHHFWVQDGTATDCR